MAEELAPFLDLTPGQLSTDRGRIAGAPLAGSPAPHAPPSLAPAPLLLLRNWLPVSLSSYRLASLALLLQTPSFSVPCARLSSSSS